MKRKVHALVSTFENLLLFKQYYETLPLLIKFIGDQDSVQIFYQG